MSEFILFLCVTAIFVLLYRTSRLKKEVRLLQGKIQSLEERFDVAEIHGTVSRPKETVHETIQQDIPAVIPDEKASHKIEATQAFPEHEIKPLSDTSPRQMLRKSELQEKLLKLWKQIEKQLVENWTGIIGAVVMVMGVAFLGIYAALKMSPLIRFFIITLFASFLFALYAILRRREFWKNLARWLRSSSGAIFLFACLGSGGIPGLKWIDEPRLALALLVFGIIVNLFFGFAGGTQLFASLHVVLSLIALGIAPQNQTTLIISAVVVLFGVILSYRDRWEIHLILSITGFLAYHLYWYSESGFFNSEAIPVQTRLTGILVTGVIGIAAALLHYRRLYRSEKFDAVPFIAHFINWCYMAVGFLLYATGSKWSTIIIGAAALCAFILARRARSLGIRWLYVTDTLIAQAMAVIALSTMERWELDGLYVMAIIFLEVIVFMTVMLLEKEKLLSRIGAYLHHATALLLVMYTMDMLDASDILSVKRSAVTLLAAFVAGLALHVFIVNRYDEKADSIDIYFRKQVELPFSLGGVLLSVMLIACYRCIYGYAWAPYASAGMMILLLYLRLSIQSNGLGVGIVMAALAIHVFCWQHIGTLAELTLLQKSLYALPLLAISLAGMGMSHVRSMGRHCLWIGVYLFSAHITLSTYYILNPVSQFLPGLVWLLLSPLFLETGLFLKRRFTDDSSILDAAGRHLINAGCIMLTLFLIRHMLVHIQSELYMGPLKVRLALELLGLAVMLHWALALQSSIKKLSAFWTSAHPLVWEVIVLFTSLTIALEVPITWHPVSWMLLAAVLLFLGNYLKEIFSRFRLYALFFFWVAAFHVAVLSSTQSSPSQHWLDREWTGGLLSILLQFGFVIVYHSRSGLSRITFPFNAPRLMRLIAAIAGRANLWVFYPLFIAVALFLYWSFGSALLTLLWVAEAFAIFVLSVVLKENHFRYLSMAALVCCLLRLVFYDLSRTATITRALVFLGVGTLMLAMNYLYGKYKERF